MAAIPNSMQLFVAYQMIKNLTTPFEEWDAFELGIIDKDGNTLKSPKTEGEKKSFGRMTIMARNIKRLLAKLPFGKTKLASFGAALILLREDASYAETIHETLSKEFKLQLNESTRQTIVPGKYKVDVGLFEELDDISGLFYINEELEPEFTICGENIFEVVDVVSRQKLLIPETLLERING